MHQNSSHPAGRLSGPREPTVAEVRGRFGDRWLIELSAATHVWAAVERPSSTALHVIVGPTLTELAAKLANA